jgi:hypothetical protein
VIEAGWAADATLNKLTETPPTTLAGMRAAIEYLLKQEGGHLDYLHTAGIVAPEVAAAGGLSAAGNLGEHLALPFAGLITRGSSTRAAFGPPFCVDRRERCPNVGMLSAQGKEPSTYLPGHGLARSCLPPSERGYFLFLLRSRWRDTVRWMAKRREGLTTR